MQSAMQMFVARFASKTPVFSATSNAKRHTTSACGALCVRATAKCGGPSPTAQDDGEEQKRKGVRLR